ncbi:MAG: sodium:proton antiporter [Candidatus Nephthysia bennettiae]|uniref:Cation:proton antiporter n=1 Tax=Candidatus Nephthysia bennettiae TaxID=3127016 RepID=A0A934K2T6_9BACT|nr:cation:proton antiporter [Candidatus Dormibacteraeota bacterium]MBJ7611437.1 cation:proton antiporter [Candidatus Dormibacteraeota bacterium]PZR87646.1 MAG: sodium:proton antiporter [Candidatus Dormibacteraeota bacterium]
MSSSTQLVAVAAVAFAAPLLLGLVPRLRVPAVVLEIVAGIVLGPVLHWVHVDLPIQVLSTLGLAFLLFLAGLEIDFDRLKGPALKLAGLGFVASLAIGVAVGFAIFAAGLVKAPLFLAITLLATSLGLVVPVLKDAGQSESRFGQQVIAAASLADFGAVILLSLFFSREAGSPGVKVALLAGFVLSVALLGLTIARAERMAWLSRALVRLQDTTAQIRVRGAVLLLIGLSALAARFGVELLLASFIAGAMLSIVDRDQMSHPQFQTKLQALGYGFLIPVFFISSGLQFDLSSLTNPASLARVPVFVAALLLVRGLPAAVYLRSVSARQAIGAGLLQATSLPFIVAATQIGLVLGVIQPSTAAALVAAGLVSVIAFPALALAVTREVNPKPAGSTPRTLAGDGAPE